MKPPRKHRHQDIPVKPGDGWRSPLKMTTYSWTVFRWRLAVMTVTRPVLVAFIVAILVCAYPLYAILDQQQTLRDQAKQLRELAEENRDAIDMLGKLTLRVTTIERPSPEQLQRGIHHALKQCARDPECRVLFAQLQHDAGREIQRRKAAGRPLHPNSTGSPPPGASVPVPPDGGRQPGGSSPGSGSPPSGGGGGTGGGGSGGGSTPPPTPDRPRPPVEIHVTPPPLPVPVPVPSICTPVAAVNCP